LHGFVKKKINGIIQIDNDKLEILYLPQPVNSEKESFLSCCRKTTFLPTPIGSQSEKALRPSLTKDHFFQPKSLNKHRTVQNFCAVFLFVLGFEKVLDKGT
jgi:hypothetical protein